MSIVLLLEIHHSVHEKLSRCQDISNPLWEIDCRGKSIYLSLSHDTTALKTDRPHKNCKSNYYYKLLSFSYVSLNITNSQIIF